MVFRCFRGWFAGACVCMCVSVCVLYVKRAAMCAFPFFLPPPFFTPATFVCVKRKSVFFFLPFLGEERPIKTIYFPFANSPRRECPEAALPPEKYSKWSLKRDFFQNNWNCFRTERSKKEITGEFRRSESRRAWAWAGAYYGGSKGGRKKNRKHNMDFIAWLWLCVSPQVNQSDAEMEEEDERIKIDSFKWIILSVFPPFHAVWVYRN